MSHTPPHALARYAVGDHQSRGRPHGESIVAVGAGGPTLGAFDVDLRRIMNCTAFRRLQHKTQAFRANAHDHFRTRLMHTLEVAAIARRLAAELQVNAALAECIALAHDLGHPPFGHAGERALHEAMADHGGFEHNRQSLRVVDYLEHPFPPFRGLNLSFETREGIIKHTSTYDAPGVGDGGRNVASPEGELGSDEGQTSLEAQIVNLADRLAYNLHDLEDGMEAGLIAEHDLGDLAEWNLAAEPVRRTAPHQPLPAVRRPILDGMLDRLMADADTESRRRLDSARPASVDDVRSHRLPLVSLSAVADARLMELERFLRQRVYTHERIAAEDRRAGDMVGELFAAFVADPGRLPQRYAARIDEQGVHRVACDYLAGMTDRFCRDAFNNKGGYNTITVETQ